MAVPAPIVSKLSVPGSGTTRGVNAGSVVRSLLTPRPVGVRRQRDDGAVDIGRIGQRPKKWGGAIFIAVHHTADVEDAERLKRHCAAASFAISAVLRGVGCA